MLNRFRIKFLNSGFDFVGDCHIFKGKDAGLEAPRAGFSLILPGDTKYSTINAQRAAWLLFIGPIPKGLYVLHKCKKQPNCVNLNHLYLGTHADNMHDVKKDRTSHWVVKTHCKNGHEWNKESTRYRPKGGRDCKLCDKIRYERKRKKKEHHA